MRASLVRLRARTLQKASTSVCETYLLLLRMPWEGPWEETKDDEDDGECLVITSDLLDKAPLAVREAITQRESYLRPLKPRYAAWIRVFNEKKRLALARACRQFEAKEAKREAKVLAEREAEAFAAAKEEAAREECQRDPQAQRAAKAPRAAAKRAAGDARWLRAHW